MFSIGMTVNSCEMVEMQSERDICSQQSHVRNMTEDSHSLSPPCDRLVVLGLDGVFVQIDLPCPGACLELLGEGL